MHPARERIHLYPDRQRASPRQSGQDFARIDRGAGRQLSRRGRRRAPRRLVRARMAVFAPDVDVGKSLSVVEFLGQQEARSDPFSCSSASNWSKPTQTLGERFKSGFLLDVVASRRIFTLSATSARRRPSVYSIMVLGQSSYTQSMLTRTRLESNPRRRLLRTRQTVLLQRDRIK